MRLVDSQQMKQMDQATIEDLGVPSLVLMENAARSLVAVLEPRLKPDASIFVCCGSGNNGGDGYALARILANRGFRVRVVAVKEPKSKDCKTNAKIWGHYGMTLPWNEFMSATYRAQEHCILIDAILGTGLEEPLHVEMVDRINFLNQIPGFKVAVDVPSGIRGSTGDAMGAAFQADLTVTFQKEKVGHHLYPGKACRGQLHCEKISIVEEIPEGGPEYSLIDQGRAKELLPIPAPDAYKHQRGHLLSLCGQEGTLGAALLAALSALKSGAGLVTAAMPAGQSQALLHQAPELMSRVQEEIQQKDLDGYSALVIGCGLGRNNPLWNKLKAWLPVVKAPLVLDADAFHALKDWSTLPAGQMVLTPHAGEFAALTGYAKPTNNGERISQALAWVERFPAVLVLKGAPTLVVAPGRKIYINGTGNQGMATAGAGDVLSGVIGAFLAQGLSPLQASLLGVWSHGKAGDLAAAAQGHLALTAGDILENLGKAFLSLQQV